MEEQSMSDPGFNRSDLAPRGAAWPAGFADAIRERLGVGDRGRCGTYRRVRQPSRSPRPSGRRYSSGVPLRPGPARGVARNTARKALLMLADQGYVRIVPGWGTFVIPRDQASST
jgi:Bacterial regulatory proteins, gntR family